MKQLFAAAAVALMLATPISAKPNPVCLPYDTYRTFIEDTLGERLFLKGVSPALVENGIVRAEVYINPEAKSLSYMYVIEDPDGNVMCLGDALPEFDFVPYSSNEPEGDPA